MLNTKTFIAALATATLTAAASAGTAPISIVSGATHGNVDLNITVKASDRAGYDYDFVIGNNSGTPGASVTGVYFESGWSTLINNSAFSGNASLFQSTATPSLSGWSDSSVAYTIGQTVIGTKRTYVNRSWKNVDILGDDIDGGIQEGGAGVFSFNSSASLVDLESALGGSGYNVGVRIQDVLSDNKSAAGWGLADAIPASEQQPIMQLPLDPEGEDYGQGEPGNESPVISTPTPTAALAGLALLGLAGFRRRRA